MPKNFLGKIAGLMSSGGINAGRRLVQSASCMTGSENVCYCFSPSALLSASLRLR